MNDEIDKLVYSINIEDKQTVAEESLGRRLSEKQIEIVSESIGDHFSDWFDRVEMAINESIDVG